MQDMLQNKRTLKLQVFVHGHKMNIFHFTQSHHQIGMEYSTFNIDMYNAREPIKRNIQGVYKQSKLEETFVGSNMTAQI